MKAEKPSFIFSHPVAPREKSMLYLTKAASGVTECRHQESLFWNMYIRKTCEKSGRHLKKPSMR